jgi:hypothetical protein
MVPPCTLTIASRMEDGSWAVGETSAYILILVEAFANADEGPDEKGKKWLLRLIRE